MTNEPRHAPENQIPTPTQWVNMFLDSNVDDRLNIARNVLATSEASRNCLLFGHERRIDVLIQEVNFLRSMPNTVISCPGTD